jgi:lipopolysaccharide biosynthesis glycosyltransferase
MKKIIVLSTDMTFLMPAETLIKSIACHNDNVKIYVLNEDLPQEWFANINRRLHFLDIQVVDVKYDPTLLDNVVVSNQFLTKMTFGRFLIPKLIPEDRVIYMDVDMVVDGSLDGLYQYPLHGHTLGAVLTPMDPNVFNAGLLLIDNTRLRATNFTAEMLEKGTVSHKKDDQSILNEVFKDDFEKLPGKYNVQIGDDLSVVYNNEYDRFSKNLEESRPFTIIHYTGVNKPWWLMSAMRLREKWWEYRNLDYPELIAQRRVAMLRKQATQRPQFFTFTYTQDLSQLEALVKAFPDGDFNIAAPTMVGPVLQVMLRYPNVRIHEQVNKYILKENIDKTTIYLDINAQPRDKQNMEIMQEMLNRQVPILTFADVKTDMLESEPDYTVIPAGDVDKMVATIRQLLAARPND